MKKIVVGLICFCVIYFALHHSKYGYLMYGYHKFWYTPTAYQSEIKKDYQKKCVLSEKFYRGTATEQKKCLQQVGQITRQKIPKLFDYWYGTPWDLNGITQTPGHGKIACGYFVTTILQDAGFRINRIKMAQMAAEPFLKKILTPSKLKRFYKKSIQTFIESVKKQGKGLYLVGLDTHIGFIEYYSEDQSVWFIHSGSLGQKCVKREPAMTSKTLLNSKYKVLAKLDDDEKFLKRWFEK